MKIEAQEEFIGWTVQETQDHLEGGFWRPATVASP